MSNLILHILQPEELKKLIRDSVFEAIDNRLYADSKKERDSKEELIKLSEVAVLLGVSKVTVHTWKRKGLIPFYRISNKIYFKKHEVLTSLKKAKNGI